MLSRYHLHSVLLSVERSSSSSYFISPLPVITLPLATFWVYHTAIDLYMAFNVSLEIGLLLILQLLPSFKDSMHGTHYITRDMKCSTQNMYFSTSISDQEDIINGNHYHPPCPYHFACRVIPTIPSIALACSLSTRVELTSESSWSHAEHKYFSLPLVLLHGFWYTRTLSTIPLILSFPFLPSFLPSLSDYRKTPQASVHIQSATACSTRNGSSKQHTANLLRKQYF